MKKILQFILPLSLIFMTGIFVLFPQIFEPPSETDQILYLITHSEDTDFVKKIEHDDNFQYWTVTVDGSRFNGANSSLAASAIITAIEVHSEETGKYFNADNPSVIEFVDRKSGEVLRRDVFPLP